MSDTGDIWREHRQHVRMIRARREDRQLGQMKKAAARINGLYFAEIGPYHYVVEYRRKAANWWPRTGAVRFGLRPKGTVYLTVAQLLTQLGVPGYAPTVERGKSAAE